MASLCLEVGFPMQLTWNPGLTCMHLAVLTAALLAKRRLLPDNFQIKLVQLVPGAHKAATPAAATGRSKKRKTPAAAAGSAKAKGRLREGLTKPKAAAAESSGDEADSEEEQVGEEANESEIVDADALPAKTKATGKAKAGRGRPKQ